MGQSGLSAETILRCQSIRGNCCSPDRYLECLQEPPSKTFEQLAMAKDMGSSRTEINHLINKHYLETLMTWLNLMQPHAPFYAVLLSQKTPLNVIPKTAKLRQPQGRGWLPHWGRHWTLVLLQIAGSSSGKICVTSSTVGRQKSVDEVDKLDAWS